MIRQLALAGATTLGASRAAGNVALALLVRQRAPLRSLVDVTLGGPGMSPHDGDASGTRLKGATLDKKTGKWKAAITVNKKRINLGTFATEKEASDAYFAAKAVYADPVHGQAAFEAEVSGGGKKKSKSKKADGAGAAAAAEGGDAAGAEEEAEDDTLRKGAAEVDDDDDQDGEQEGKKADAKAAKGAGKSKDAAAAPKKGKKKDAATSVPSKGTEDTAAAATTEATGAAGAGNAFLGVVYDPNSFNTTTKTLGVWEAVITTPAKGDSAGQEISGGDYDTPEEAARAYDSLARMYYGADAETNFALDAASTWVPPAEATFAASQGVIEAKPGVPLTVDEIERALRAEKGIDVRTIDLAGKSDLAEHMVFVTGRDAQHMGKMADTLSRALRKRKLPGVDPTVEARDMDDWMIVDCGNIVVNVMDAEAREVFDLEAMYERMVDGEDPQMAGLSYEEWLEKNPIPEKWLKRLERDEEEIDAAARVKSGKSSRASSSGSAAGEVTDPSKIINVGASLKRKRGTQKLKGGR